MSEIVDGLWRFEAEHPEWNEGDGGEDGWERLVAWYAARTARGVLLIDPLVVDWDGLDALVEREGGCAGIVRLVHWHERNIPSVAARYDVEVWAGAAPTDAPPRHPAHQLSGVSELWDGITLHHVERVDETALWLPGPRALVFGDAVLRREDERLHVCPPTWVQPDGGYERLLELLAGLAELPIEHVLVSHGGVVLGEGADALSAAIAAA